MSCLDWKSIIERTRDIMRNLIRIVGLWLIVALISITSISGLSAQSGPNPPEITSNPAGHTG